jgi:nucleoside-diphosphate-sugar epimerase
MALHVVVGSGPVGTTLANTLLGEGHDVRVVTRRGTGPEGAERISADAADPATLAKAAEGAAVIYNCANPAYDRWVKDWPPIANSILAAARENEAVVAITGNLYGYGPVTGPMTHATSQRPSSVKGGVRKQMWEDALEAQRAGEIPGAVEVRGSDYVGDCPSMLTMMVLPRMAAGKSAALPADLDALHTWSSPADTGRLLALVGSDSSAWGQAWHVPSPEPVTIRTLVEMACAEAGIEQTKLGSLPQVILKTVGLFNSMAGSLAEMTYQFRAPFILDATDTEAKYGMGHASLEDMVRANVAYFRRESLVGAAAN